MASVITDIIDSIFNPTTVPQDGVIRLMNYAFYGLFLVLFGLVFLTDFNLHVIALLVLAICLCLSMRWFVAELTRIDQESKSSMSSETHSDKAGKSEGVSSANESTSLPSSHLHGRRPRGVSENPKS